ncbi:MAG TPA: NAD(P)H-hydrate dehydratase [Daejeonella sp.]|nr:NAD(P)H-hydrate dehydratase [Daejeonella sp.]
MLNLLTSDQTRAADTFTINNHQIASVDLMEKASRAFVRVFGENYADLDVSICIYCGTGNNGGDGLAIARLLKEQGYDRLSVKVIRFNNHTTGDFEANLRRLALTGIQVTEIHKAAHLPSEENTSILIDALLGSGLSRPLEGEFKELVQQLNQLNKTIVSVDVPTGFPTEGLIDQQSTIIKADLVISFQRPKINFFFPESATFIKRFRFVEIGLDEDYIQSQPGGWKLLEADDVRSIIKPRPAFSHKGTFGHALIIAGNTDTMGAALLCGDACVHSGAGLTTLCIPPGGLTALNISLPEAMALTRGLSKEWQTKIELWKYQAIAVGPGLGRGESQDELLEYIITNTHSPLVLDADALNILSVHSEWMHLLPAKTILTPHVKEFDRLFGNHSSWWERVSTARKAAKQYDVIILLKNQYSFIVLPDGNVVINPTGNPAMAIGGMGDVLTGMIVALLAQGYKPEEAALAACYLHGKAGNQLKEKFGMHSIPPRYLIRKLPEIIGGCCLG